MRLFVLILKTRLQQNEKALIINFLSPITSRV